MSELILTWPGGWAFRLDSWGPLATCRMPGTRHLWRAYWSPVDAHRENHLTSWGGVSIPYAVMDDYGTLVAVPGPQ